jgi:hypothetical protein
MAIVKANEDSEAGKMPKEEMLAAMGKFNEELAEAGVLLGGEGLHPSSKGARIGFGGAERTVTDGPFTETKELIAGFWILQVDSFEGRWNGSSAARTRTKKGARLNCARSSRRRTSAMS